MISELAQAIRAANRPLIGTPHDLFCRHVGMIQSVIIEIEHEAGVETALGVLDDLAERLDDCVSNGVDLGTMEHHGPLWSLACQMALLKTPLETSTAVHGVRAEYRDFVRALRA